MTEDYERKEIPRTERNGLYFIDESLKNYSEKIAEERLKNGETYD